MSNHFNVNDSNASESKIYHLKQLFWINFSRTFQELFQELTLILSSD